MTLPRHLLHIDQDIVASYVKTKEFQQRPEGYKQDTYKLMEALGLEVDKLKE